ncbi:MAG: methyltransferase domain-containing protein [Pseudomonadota bacterium]
MKISFILLVFIGLFANCVNAQDILFVEQMVKYAKKHNLSLPKPLSDGRIQSLNNRGAMSPKLDWITRDFIKYGSKKNRKVFEVDSLYGLVSVILSLKAGNHDYTVVDRDKRHLGILALEIKNKYPEFSSYIKFIDGEYPNDINFPDEEFDAILISRGLHFLSPYEIEKTLTDFYRILKPGGRVYTMAITPYVKRFASFIPEYEKNFDNGDDYPGFVKSLAPYADPAVTTKKQMENLHKGHFMFLDSRVLVKAFKKAGFEIYSAKETPLPYVSKTWQYDGRENVGVIAVKP